MRHAPIGTKTPSIKLIFKLHILHSLTIFGAPWYKYELKRFSTDVSVDTTQFYIFFTNLLLVVDETLL